MLIDALVKHLTAEAARCSSPSTFQPSVIVLSSNVASRVRMMININADGQIGWTWARYARWRRDQRIERARVRRAKRGHR